MSKARVAPLTLTGNREKLLTDYLSRALSNLETETLGEELRRRSKTYRQCPTPYQAVKTFMKHSNCKEECLRGTERICQIVRSNKNFLTFSQKISNVPKVLQRSTQVADPWMYLRSRLWCLTKTPNGRPWAFEPFPISRLEMETICREKRFFPLKHTLFGQYDVFPRRESLKHISNIFWTGRFINSSLRDHTIDRTGVTVSPKLLTTYRAITLEFLGNGSSDLTFFQRKLLGQIHYFLRRCRKNK